MVNLYQPKLLGKSHNIFTEIWQFKNFLIKVGFEKKCFTANHVVFYYGVFVRYFHFYRLILPRCEIFPSVKNCLTDRILFAVPTVDPKPFFCVLVSDHLLVLRGSTFNTGRFGHSLRLHDFWSQLISYCGKTTNINY